MHMYSFLPLRLIEEPVQDDNLTSHVMFYLPRTSWAYLKLDYSLIDPSPPSGLYRRQPRHGGVPRGQWSRRRQVLPSVHSEYCSLYTEHLHNYTPGHLHKGTKVLLSLGPTQFWNKEMNYVSRDRSFLLLLLLVQQNGWDHLAGLKKCPACK